LTTVSPSEPGFKSPVSEARLARERLKRADRRGGRLLFGLAIGAVIVALLVMLSLLYQIIHSASPAIDRYGLGFFVHTTWQPVEYKLGAASLIYGTLMTAGLSLIGATILGVAIGLLLAYMVPKRVSATVGPVVEMLAAVPSIVIGLLAIVVIGPFVVAHVEPALHSVLGFIPVFGKPGLVGNSIFTLSLALTFMVLPIIAALTRDIFLTVPSELRDGAAALGATRWEVIRGIVLPTTVGGIASACVLGFGRALGEAIVAAQIVGDETVIHFPNLFLQGDTLGAIIVNQFTSPANAMTLSALYYCAVVLLLFSLASNLLAQYIAHRARYSAGL
jgi:phosphate transport system permease protein